MEGCRFCGKKCKNGYFIIKIPEFGEAKLCLKCFNSLREPGKRFKTDKYTQPRDETANYLWPPKNVGSSDKKIKVVK